MLNPAYTVVGRSDRHGRLDERKAPTATCQHEVLAAVVALTEQTGGGGITGGQIYAEMLAQGTRYSKSTVLKTVQRMKAPPTRPPYVRLEQVGDSGFRLAERS
ncbi:MAG: hypothetical protein ACRD6W_08400 [Nitrososphaerales archaeon]